MAVTPLSPAGTLDSPKELLPHATTVPSLFNARLWKKCVLAATAVTPLSPAGTLDSPRMLLPHATTVPRNPLQTNRFIGSLCLFVKPSLQARCIWFGHLSRWGVHKISRSCQRNALSRRQLAQKSPRSEVLTKAQPTITSPFCTWDESPKR